MGGIRMRVVALAIGLVFAALPATIVASLAAPASAFGGVAVSDLPPRTGVWPVNLTLYGNAGRGWGFSNATISEPGPTLTVYLGDTVNLTLVSNDSAPHNWFIDYDNGLGPNGGEPSSPDFNVPGRAIVVWSFVADRSGNWTYRCRIHPTSMTGNISIVGGPPVLPARGFGIPLISGLMVATLGFVLVFAAVYHVRAVRASKRMK